MVDGRGQKEMPGVHQWPVITVILSRIEATIVHFAGYVQCLVSGL